MTDNPLGVPVDTFKAMPEKFTLVIVKECDTCCRRFKTWVGLDRHMKRCKAIRQ